MLGLLLPGFVNAQTAGASRRSAVHFAGDALARYEWTRDIPAAGGGTTKDARWRLQVRPRFEAIVGPLDLGVGGELNYSQDQNDEPPAGQETLGLVRDNYRSRDARLDLAYARLNLGPVRAVGGRFEMPLALTEMLWDDDLRPQGGAVSLQLGEPVAGQGLVLSGLYATGSHVFEDRSLVYGGSARLAAPAGRNSRIEIVGSYLQFDKLDRLGVPIRRQNTRELDTEGRPIPNGLLAVEYRVADVVVRLAATGQFPLLLIADYCWNTTLESGNRGLWLSSVLGTLEGSRAQATYTYASVDRDATLAAFNGDDFFWGTGWEGHRVDIGSVAARNSSVHAIVQWQRFKDNPDPAVAEAWVKRWRLEWRSRF